MIYVLHFDRPFHHAQHYIGFSAGTGQDRVEEHRRGRGAKILAAARRVGIDFELVAFFNGDRKLERKLHKGKSASPSRELKSICPLCRYLLREKLCALR